MTPKQKRRLLATCLILGGVGVATALAITALSDNISYLYSPSTVVENRLEPGTRFRLGGVVLEDSIERIQGLQVRFAVTDRVRDHQVLYEGILPDLFREGQSVIAHGHLGEDGVFQANKILAKHDETYMPAEVMAAMEQAQGKRGAAYGGGDGSGYGGNGAVVPAPTGTEVDTEADGDADTGTNDQDGAPAPTAGRDLPDAGDGNQATGSAVPATAADGRP